LASSSGIALYECLSCQPKTLSTDPTLGTITIHEIVPPSVQGTVVLTDPTPTALSAGVVFTGLRLTDSTPAISGNPTPLTSFACSQPVAIHRTLSFALNGTSASFSVPRTIVQIYRFSNRSGEAYVADGDCAESNFSVNADDANQVRETCETDNTKSYTQ